MTNRKEEMENWLNSPDKMSREFIDYVRNPETTMDERRASVKAIERHIKQLVGSLKFSSYQPMLHEDEWKRVKQWVAMRKEVFGTLLLPTAKEVERVIQLNDQLLRLSQELNERAKDICRFDRGRGNYMELLDNGQNRSVECCLDYEYEKSENGGMFDMGNDEWYGSDFSYMLSLEYQMTKLPHCRGMHAYWVSYGFDEEPKDSDRPFVDDRPWNDGVLLLPAFEDIPVCYALHALCCHFSYTLPDVMRMNNFHTYICSALERNYPYDYEQGCEK